MTTYSESQQTGQTGEAWVTSLLTACGLVVHPVAAGADFGIDLRVEIPQPDRTISGVDFNIQVKTFACLPDPRAGQLRPRPVRIETGVYWHAKISPTLIVICDLATNRAYYEWVHVAISGERLIDAIRAGRKTIVPLVPAEQFLNDTSIGTIIEDARKAYARVIHSVFGNQLHSDGLVLYGAISNALDILFDWLIGLGFQMPEVRADHLLNSIADINPIDKQYLEQAAAYRLTPPQHATTLMPANQLYAAILAFRSLALFASLAENLPDEDARARMVKDSPLVAASRTTSEMIRRLYLDAYEPYDQAYRQAAEAALYRNHERGLVCFAAPVVVAQRSLALIALVLRDYLRSLRRVLFPPAPRTEPMNPFQHIEVLAYSDVKPSTEWLPSGDDGSGGAG